MSLLLFGSEYVGTYDSSSEGGEDDIGDDIANHMTA